MLNNPSDETDHIQMTPLEKSEQLCQKLRIDAKSRYKKALESGDFSEWLIATTHMREAAHSKNFVWIYEMPDCETYSLEDAIKSEYTEKSISNRMNEIKYARELYARLKQLPGKPEMIKITLKRIRQGNENWEYRVMAEFPAGSRLWLDPHFGNEAVTEDNPAIIYYQPNIACCMHACDVLYKRITKETGKNADYIPYVSWQDLDNYFSGKMDNLNPETKRLEFQNPITRTKLSEDMYVLSAITGRFGDTEPRWRIPPRFLE